MVRISDERLRKNHSRTASPNFESSTDAPVKGFEFRVIDQTGWYRGLIARPSGITFFIFKPMKLILFKSSRVVPRPKVVLVRTAFLFSQNEGGFL